MVSTFEQSAFYYNIPDFRLSFNWGIALLGFLRPGDAMNIVDNIVIVSVARESAMSHRPCDSGEDTGVVCILGWELRS